MHGTKSTLVKGEHCCGTAGETIVIERNTVLYDGHKTRSWMVWSGPAIKIRGNPLDKAVAKNNVFRHTNEGDAIKQNGEPNRIQTGLLWVFGAILAALTDSITKPIEKSGNTYGCPDFTATVDQGDFVGDSKQDDFMATGVTWWAKYISPRGDGQWRYLNTMREKQDALQVVNADTDNVSDVMPRVTPPGELEKYSKGGRSPWQILIRR
jgi:hypothetical protein